jgi:hypothetical protein
VDDDGKVVDLKEAFEKEEGKYVISGSERLPVADVSPDEGGVQAVQAAMADSGASVPASHTLKMRTGKETYNHINAKRRRSLLQDRTADVSDFYADAGSTGIQDDMVTTGIHQDRVADAGDCVVQGNEATYCQNEAKSQPTRSEAATIPWSGVDGAVDQYLEGQTGGGSRRLMTTEPCSESVYTSGGRKLKTERRRPCSPRPR